MENKYIPVKGKDNLLRDSYSNGIVNNDIQAYKSYIESYKQKISELNKINSLEKDMNTIKDDINEIKDLLKSLLSK